MTVDTDETIYANDDADGLTSQRFSRHSKPRRVTAWAITGGLLLFALAAFAWWLARPPLLGGPVPPGDAPFVQSAWLAAGSEFDGTRMSMRQSAATAVAGRGEDAVRAALGAPNQIEPTPLRWWYLLGPEPGPFGIDSLWLVLDFSIDGLARPIELTD